MAAILLADDDATTRAIVSRGLEADGHQVAVVPTGNEALELMRAQPDRFDLLITDVMMPGMTGLELASRAAEMRPRLGILIMSGLIEQLARASVIEGVRVETISKPFTLEQVRERVRSVIAGQRS